MSNIRCSKIILFAVVLILIVSLPLFFCSADKPASVGTQNLAFPHNENNDLNISSVILNHSENPKLANLFYRWHINADEVAKLARYDILIIDMEVMIYSPDNLKQIKKINPDIILLAYLASEEIRGDSGTLSGTMRQKLYKKIDSNWWLKNSQGNTIEWWPGNPMVNITSTAKSVSGQTYADRLASFVKEELIDTGYFNGVFYDNVWSDLSFMQHLSIDLDKNGQKDSLSYVNSKWQEGMKNILTKTKQKLGSNYLVFGNGGEYYSNYLNGVLFESFPNQGWSETLAKYRYINNNGQTPSVGIINTNVNNNGNSSDYQKMRFGLTSSLLDDGYYSFDNGDQSHTETWWYDEYEVYLGGVASPATKSNGSSSSFSKGLWQRDFKNGLVIVNSGSTSQRVKLSGEYEKINGTQDSITNDGTFVNAVTVKPNDGIILLRPIDKIVNTTYFNGSFAKSFNQYGNVMRTGFFAYNDDYRGGNQVIEQDINNDNKKEFIVANVNKVDIYSSNGDLEHTFYPYTKNYDKGVNITVGDLDNNGTMEIITGTEFGGGPHVRIFNNQGTLINPGFFAYAKNFRGGVNITVGDLEGDGIQEIIAGAGVGGGPHVRVFAANGVLINPGFFAYDKAFRGGVNVSAGDIDGDGIDEIITGPGKGGSPEIKSFDRHGQKDGPTFMAFDASSREGVEVASADLDGDGKAEIIALTRDVFTLAGF
jgi:hypothetical protein